MEHGGEMNEEAVTRLVSNLYVLQGYLRDAHIKILALESLLKDTKPVHYEQYRQLVRKHESESKNEFPLEEIEGLRKALLQSHS